MKHILALFLIIQSIHAYSCQDLVCDQFYQSPQDIFWAQTNDAFLLLKESNYRKAHEIFEKVYSECLDQIGDPRFSNVTNACLFGLLICADRLHQMDSFYINLGKGAIDLVIALDSSSFNDDDCDDDFMDEILTHTNMCEEDLIDFANKCKTKEIQSIAFSLIQD